MRRTLSTLTTVAAVLPVLLVAGCGNDNSTASTSGDASSSDTASSTPASSTSPTTSASASPDQGTVVKVKVRGDEVTPNGERIKAKVGEPVTLQVDANRAGELHVHSSPEQELEYKNGRTDLEVTIERPGVVDIEDHIADVVVVQLQVS
jgi:plastocyanin